MSLKCIFLFDHKRHINNFRHYLVSAQPFMTLTRKALLNLLSKHSSLTLTSHVHHKIKPLSSPPPGQSQTLTQKKNNLGRTWWVCGRKFRVSPLLVSWFVNVNCDLNNNLPLPRELRGGLNSNHSTCKDVRNCMRSLHCPSLVSQSVCVLGT